MLREHACSHHPGLKRLHALTAVAEINSKSAKAELSVLCVAAGDQAEDVEGQMELISGFEAQQLGNGPLISGLVEVEGN